MDDIANGGVSAGQGLGGQADGTTVLTQHFSYLPWPAEGIMSVVSRFQMLTSSQIRSLCYQTGTATGREIRSRRHLARLTKLGLLKRFWGVYQVPEYVYIPAGSKARTPNMHTLDIAELYVRMYSECSLNESEPSIIFDPEPLCHVQIGHMVLKPDAYVDMGKMRYFIEIDRGTEFRSALAQKMRRYLSAYEHWEDPTFPLVVWVVHNSDRKRFIENILRTQAEPNLFVCMLFSEAAAQINPRPN